MRAASTRFLLTKLAASTAWRPTPEVPRSDPFSLKNTDPLSSNPRPRPSPGARARKSHRLSRSGGTFSAEASARMARAPSRGSAACAASSALAKARETARSRGGPAVSSIGRARLGSEAAKKGETFPSSSSRRAAGFVFVFVSRDDENSSRARSSAASVSVTAAASASAA